MHHLKWYDESFLVAGRIQLSNLIIKDFIEVYNFVEEMRVKITTS